LLPDLLWTPHYQQPANVSLSWGYPEYPQPMGLVPAPKQEASSSSSSHAGPQEYKPAAPGAKRQACWHTRAPVAKRPDDDVAKIPDESASSFEPQQATPGASRIDPKEPTPAWASSFDPEKTTPASASSSHAGPQEYILEHPVAKRSPRGAHSAGPQEYIPEHPVAKRQAHWHTRAPVAKSPDDDVAKSPDESASSFEPKQETPGASSFDPKGPTPARASSFDPEEPTPERTSSFAFKMPTPGMSFDPKKWLPKLPELMPFQFAHNLLKLNETSRSNEAGNKNIAEG
jgi:hypothetical protein